MTPARTRKALRSSNELRGAVSVEIAGDRSRRQLVLHPVVDEGGFAEDRDRVRDFVRAIAAEQPTLLRNHQIVRRSIIVGLAGIEAADAIALIKERAGGIEVAGRDRLVAQVAETAFFDRARTERDQHAVAIAERVGREFSVSA